MKISIIGLGLIGGSIAIDIKKRGLTDHVIGCDSNKLHAQTALNMGIVDEVCTIEELMPKSDLIVLAVPLDAAIKLLPSILDKVTTQVVTDVVSTKEKLIELVKYHPKRVNYVAAHPMAGTEYSGPWAAISNMYDGKAVIFCNTQDSDVKAVETVKVLYECLNMRIVYMDAQYHDVHVAYISHISHITSFALALTVLDKEKDEKHIFDLASGGFDSTVRLAKSSADMWVPIFIGNRDNILEVLDTYIEKIQYFKESIIKMDGENLKKMILEANKIKKVLKK